MPSLSTYRRYVEFLEQRIAAQQRLPKELLLTEDSVRYSFFLAALQTTDIAQHEIILEFPHPKFEGKKIDTYIPAAGARPKLYIEFKFHRVSDSTSPKPQKAGALFKDFSRLSSIESENSRCLVIYLTDFEMANYFEKNADAYSAFWHMNQAGDNFLYDNEFRENRTETFRKSSGVFYEARVYVEFCAQLADNHHLRIFEIKKV